MANIAIVAIVAPPGSSSPDWTYHGAGNPPVSAQNQTVNIPSNTDLTFMLTLIPGGDPSDTCIFDFENPLTFQDQNGDNINPPPSWYQNQQLFGDSTILTFTDHNNAGEQEIYKVLINAIYNDTPVQSPDPTIVNEGTDSSMVFRFPVRSSSPQPNAVTA